MVAAIRGVTTGGYLDRIREFEMMELRPELHSYRRTLIGMTDEYERAVKTVVDVKDNEYIDFHARRLVEMAGNIVMGYLLLLDTQRDERYKTSTDVFIKRGKADNHAKASFVFNSHIDDLGFYKPE